MRQRQATLPRGFGAHAKPRLGRAGFGIDLLGGPDKVPLLATDIVFLERSDYSWGRISGALANRVWNTDQVGINPSLLALSLCLSPSCRALTTVYNGETAGAGWRLEPHPTPVPAELQATAGESCAHFMVDASTSSASAAMLATNAVWASTTQSFYPVLLPTKTYTVEFWHRARAGSSFTATLAFSRSDLVPPVNFTVAPSWNKFVYAFRPAYLYNSSGPVVTVQLTWAPEDLFLDNYRIYENSSDFLFAIPEDVAALQASGLAYLRTHWLIKSSFGYTMNSLTNPAGVTEYERSSSPHTLHTLQSIFRIMQAASIRPWLQVEQYFSEAELLGLVEFLAAPYDPAKDSPERKPWAYKRYLQNQSAPWTDVFPHFIYEVRMAQRVACCPTCSQSLDPG